MLEKILCATDGSRASEAAVAFATNFARVLGVPVCFLTVERATPDKVQKSRYWGSEVLKAADEQTNRELAHARRHAEENGLQDVTCVTVQARDVDEAIAEYAASEGYDHIVTGHAGKTAMSRIGSVAYGVAEKANCPVTIVR